MLKLVSALVIAAAAGCDGSRLASARHVPGGQDRLPPIQRPNMTEAQRIAADRFAVGRGKQPFGPFVPLLRSPELMLAAQSMGDYLRFKSAVSPRLREMAILLACRAWGQEYEWGVHYPLALQAGLRRDVADAIANGHRPLLDEEEEAAYELVY
jgi:4-carboxymuconolactone decarboxylase